MLQRITGLVDNLSTLDGSQVIFSRIIVALFLIPSIYFSAGCGNLGYRLHGHEVTAPLYYRAKQGDTLLSVSRKYRVPVDSLVWLNGYNPYSKLLVGERILVSYSGSSTASTADFPGLGNSSRSASGKKYGLAEGSSGPKKLKGGSTIFVSDKLFWPTAEGRISSYFGKRGSKFHDGIDIAAKTGTPVLAASSGEVIHAGSGLRGYGKLVILRASDGMLTVYAHNSRLMVKVGQRVSRGEKIAEVGSTGRSSGPHLHFEVRVKHARKGYLAVDPLSFYRKTSAPANYRVNEKLTPLVGKY